MALLDQVPRSFWTSPGVLAVGGVFVLLYGIVLFAVVTDRRRSAERAAREARERAALAQVAPPSLQGPTSIVVPPTPRKAAGPPKSPRPSPSPKPAPTPPRASPSGPRAKTPKASVAPPPERTPEDPPPPPPPPPPIPAQPPRIETWGRLSGSTLDCEFRFEGSSLTIEVPGILHVLSPELNTRNSPRLLTEARGDFVAQVRVEGRILPGTRPLANLPFTYQGAGLLLWLDENNYLRLERSSSFNVVDGKRLNQVMLELCRNGRTVPALTRDVREADLILKMDRRGPEVRCSYSPDDGRTWLEIKRQPMTLPAAVNVGVSASNVSRKAFSARLDGFSLTGPGIATSAVPGSSPIETLTGRLAR